MAQPVSIFFIKGSARILLFSRARRRHPGATNHRISSSPVMITEGLAELRSAVRVAYSDG